MEKNYVGCERNITLIMDFYELTMAYNYFKLGKQDEIVYFDMFYRKNPDQGGFVIFAGLQQLIEAIENMLILDTNADPSSKDYAQATSRMERVMDRLVDKIDPTDGLRESAMSELDIEIQSAGGLDAWIKATKEKLKRISKDLYFLDTQARREINAGGAFDSVEELEDAIEAEQREYNELKDKYNYVISTKV